MGVLQYTFENSVTDSVKHHTYQTFSHIKIILDTVCPLGIFGFTYQRMPENSKCAQMSVQKCECLYTTVQYCYVK